MKKLFVNIIILLLCLNPVLFSQDTIFKPFKVDVGFSFGFPTDNSSLAAGIYVEPRYGVNSRLTLGIRLEDILVNSGVSVNWNSTKIGAEFLVPILLTGDYYFSLANVRPFIGAGIGMYKLILNGISASTSNLMIGSNTTTTNFGFAPRIGLNAGHFRLAAIYNYTGKGISDIVGIQIGFEIGGGRIKGNN